MKYKLPFQGEWHVFDDSYLQKLAKDGHEDEADALRMMWDEYESNRIAFFLAHGGQRDFINDTEHNLCVLWGSERSGKTFAGIARTILRIIPTDENWDCFKSHGIKRPEWTGPKQVMLASYIMNIHCRKTLWPALAWLLPEHELGVYSPHWKPKDKRMKRKTVNWKDAPEVHLACGSECHFYSYKESSEAYDGTAYDYGHFDEQIPEQLFDSAWQRGATRDNYCACITATPHLVPGRPDTGAAGWVVRMCNGLLNKGLSFKSYSLTRDSVPEAIISKQRQKADYDRLIVQPALARNTRRIRDGRSRWFGVPEASEGVLYDFNPSIHLVEPFKVPQHWTLCRAFDPGKEDPFAGLWAAITPWQDIVLFREYYQPGLGMQENVRNIVAASGNELRRVPGKVKRIEDDVEVPVYEEVFKTEKYSWSVMDGRTFKMPTGDASQTQGLVYARLGLRCIPASFMKNEEAIPIVNEYFELSPDRIHLMARMKIKDEIIDPATNCPLVGAPRIYVFSTLHMFRTEIAAYSDVKSKKDHLMTALKYMILARPRYLGQPMTKPVVRKPSGSYASRMSRYN